MPAGGRRPAAAAPPQPVQDDPADWTPHLTDGEVWALARVGDTVLVAGEFGAVTSADKATRYERHNLMAFRISDGTVLDLAPKFDGPVYALAPGPDGTVIAAGDFRAVDGLPQRAITRLDLVTGRPVPGFAPKITGEVLTLARHDHDLYVGGRIAVDGQTYSRGLIRMSADTGALDPAFDARLAAPADRPVKVQDVAISPDGARLLAIGSFTTADSNPREQVAMLDISTPAAKVTDWHTGFYGLDDCGDGFHTYLRAADFSPDGRFAVIVTSGHSSDDELACGTAARYETAGHGEQQPTWVNHTGGNSLFAVEVTPPRCTSAATCSGWTTRTATSPRAGSGRPQGHRRDRPPQRPGAALESHPHPRRRPAGVPVHRQGPVRGLGHRPPGTRVPRPRRVLPAPESVAARAQRGSAGRSGVGEPAAGSVASRSIICRRSRNSCSDRASAADEAAAADVPRGSRPLTASNSTTRAATAVASSTACCRRPRPGRGSAPVCSAISRRR
ncbi:hypothetical protein ACFQY4_13695 [Catellatospora bangladeshensis]|uniref:hypothetical protein n=1 Tax=Catellatospora bangladeshensis TaxID=310355 RepID=UPI003615CED5